MKTSASLKLIVIPCVVYVTWMATQSILVKKSLSQTVAQRVASPTVKINPASKTNKVSVAPSATPAAAARPAGNSLLVSSHSLKDLSFEVEGNTTHVHASVDLMSLIKGPYYLWRLKVTNLDNDQVVSDVPYLEQRFQIAQSGRMTPTFFESVQLPSGRYEFRLSLYRLPGQHPVQEVLHDPVKEVAATLIAAPRIIEIP